MKYRKLGRTGFEVSDIAHGLWGMSGWSGSDDKESLAAMQLGVDEGCNFFDTAWAYGEGKSDGLLGEIMAQAIEGRTHLKVDRRFYLAGTYICQQAILAGRIDVYPEYTGTALTAILKQNADGDEREVYGKPCRPKVRHLRCQ